MRTVLFASLAASLAFVPLVALAQAFPSKPVRMIVPFPPGGVDVTIRLLQKSVQDDLGQPLVIENRPGANGYIGAEAVARSAPDGYTLLATSSGTLVSGPAISKDTPFDTIRDFTPVTQMFRSVGALVVNASLPVGTVAELIDYARKNPAKLSYGSSGVGSVQHLDGELLKRAAGINMTHVPYKGGGPQSQAVVAGEIQVSFHPLQQVRPHIQSAKVKILAVYGAGQRFAQLPNVPDITEPMPGHVVASSWTGILGPAGLPAPVLTRLNATLVKALTAPDLRPKFEENAVVVANRPEEFGAFIRRELDTAARQVKDLKSAGVQLE